MLDDPAYPDDTIPKYTFLTADKQLYVNGEAIELWWHPNAHTDGDILVFFRRSDVIVAGDLLHTDTFPVFDAEAGGGLQGMLNGLNHIIDIAVPRFNQMDGTRIIPGHGRLCTESDIAELRDMATIIRDRIQYMVQKNMTLEQVKAVRPTVDYNPVYGETTGFWTMEKFIETVYADLKKPRQGPAPKSGLNFSDGGR
jgi:glyoxylase-like metal-dependent hydrolase (beta-lactamase superfamily II)